MNGKSEMDVMNKKDSFGEKRVTISLPAIGWLALLVCCIVLCVNIAPQISKQIEIQSEMIRQKKEISSMIDSAKECEQREDYETALSIIRTGLNQYPSSDKLINKESEYKSILGELVKESTLDSAAQYAQTKDYVHAISIMKAAQTNYGEQDEYTQKIKEYSDLYIEEILSETEALVQLGDYLEAIEVIDNCLSLVGDNANLEMIKSSYVDIYSNGICAQVDQLVTQENYEDAIDLLTKAKQDIGENDRILAKIEDVNKVRPKLFTEELSPYLEDEYEIISSKNPVEMCGHEYNVGFKLSVYSSEGAFFNLDQKYTQMKGKFAVSYSWGLKDASSIEIYADDTLVFADKILPGDLPHEFSLDLEGISKMKIVKKGTAEICFVDTVIR